METEKIFKALFENFPSGNNRYKKTYPKSKRFQKRKETERKNNRADSDKNQIFFDFIAFFSAMAGAGMAASAMIVVTMVMVVFVMVFVFTASAAAAFVFMFVFVTFAGHFLILLHV